MKIRFEDIVNDSLQFSFKAPESFPLAAEQSNNILEAEEESKPKKVKERKIFQAI